MNVLLTGANRGIGLELVRLYLASGNRVIATARNLDQAQELKNLEKVYQGSLDTLSLDTANDSLTTNLSEKLKSEKLDVLINNAGVLDKPGNWFDSQAMQHSWDVNTLGPLRVIDACRAALERSDTRKIINVSSIMASIAYTQADNMPYRVSKAALNMATRMLAMQLQEKNFCVVALHPGWVKTDMGGPQAPTSPEESAKAIVNIIESLTVEDSGRFINALKPEKDITW